VLRDSILADSGAPMHIDTERPNAAAGDTPGGRNRFCLAPPDRLESFKCRRELRGEMRM